MTHKIVLKPIVSNSVFTVTDAQFNPSRGVVDGSFFRIRPSMDWAQSDVDRIKDDLVAKGAKAVVTLPIPTGSHTPETVVQAIDPTRDIRAIVAELLRTVNADIRDRVTEIVSSVVGK